MTENPKCKYLGDQQGSSACAEDNWTVRHIKHDTYTNSIRPTSSQRKVEGLRNTDLASIKSKQT